MRVVLICVMLVACGQPAPTRADAELQACREALKATLVDPGSAQFSEEHLTNEYPDERVYGVTLNAKNRMGGYVGRAVRYCRVNAATGRVTEVV